MGDRLPLWLRKKNFLSGSSLQTSRLLSEIGLNTVCHEARCPNRQECYSNKTATFMILGKICTRACAFCGVQKGHPEQPDHSEPFRVATAAEKLGLKYVVVTSVTRDDLSDGGAEFFAQTAYRIKSSSIGCKIEFLIPDFKGDEKSLEKVFLSQPNIINHNVETVPSLYSGVRPGADFKRSLAVLSSAKKAGFLIKTGIILGMGETFSELRESFEKLASAGVDILTIGQYMRPSADNIQVNRYLLPEEFEEIREIAVNLGIKTVVSGPLVRSSYKARECFEKSSSF
ncbi:lipoyl synthase [candidate division WOR-3 bacterium]|nr:lipoyl synthase [candidate division WOR-3 bacterium]